MFLVAVLAPPDSFVGHGRQSPAALARARSERKQKEDWTVEQPRSERKQKEDWTVEQPRSERKQKEDWTVERAKKEG